MSFDNNPATHVGQVFLRMSAEISNSSVVLEDASNFVDLIIKYAKLIRMRSDLVPPSPAIGSPSSELIAPILADTKSGKKGGKDAKANLGREARVGTDREQLHDLRDTIVSGD